MQQRNNRQAHTSSNHSSSNSVKYSGSPSPPSEADSSSKHVKLQRKGLPNSHNDLQCFARSLTSTQI
jgi:hypothetical protein